jgi:hypothetical protein
VLKYGLDSFMAVIQKFNHRHLFYIAVLLVFAAGVASGAVLYLHAMAQRRDLATGKFFAPAVSHANSGQLHLVRPTTNDQQAIELTALESIATTAPAGSQATATIKQFTGTRAFGTMHYQIGSPDINFIAAKDIAGNWHVIKTDYKLNIHGPGPHRMVRTGHLNSL